MTLKFLLKKSIDYSILGPIKMNIEELPIDIAIIGGGLSGLAAALEIVDTNKEVNVAVFEARERVGGRTCSMPIGPKNVRFDIGGQWVGTNQHYIMDLAKRFEVETVPQRYEGRVVSIFLFSFFFFLFLFHFFCIIFSSSSSFS